MKKIIYLLVFLVVSSCAVEDDFIESREVKDTIEEVSSKTMKPVTLIKAWDHNMNLDSGETFFLKKFTVKVANLGYEKKVSIYHKKQSGDWGEIPLSYSFNIDDQSEIWTTRLQTIGTEYVKEFVVKYEVNGKTYWDNNNGENYWVFTRPQGYRFGDNLKVSVDQEFSRIYYHSNQKRSFNILVDVKGNIGDNKEVGVVYTTDNWASYQFLSLEPRSDYGPVPGYYVISPNYFGIERWHNSVLIDRAVDAVEYAVVYKVDGVDYWDNNYGRNYRISKEF
ncbi:hypothetical protein [Aquimarina sp. SS2-1]|uniref:hypothetical protein n=1 Tax=Aquimarina besae TaxID=3342247 RepID=UPI00366DE78D